MLLLSNIHNIGCIHCTYCFILNYIIYTVNIQYLDVQSSLFEQFVQIFSFKNRYILQICTCIVFMWYDSWLLHYLLLIFIVIMLQVTGENSLYMKTFFFNSESDNYK